MSLFAEHRRCRVLRLRSATTLLETLLALSLLFVLMGTTVTATSLYWRYRSQTTDRVLPSLILSGLLEDMAGDLRAVEAISESSTQSLEATGPQIGERALDFGRSAADKPIHFVGSEHAFAVVRNGRNTRFQEAGGVDTEVHYTVLWISPKLREVRLATHRVGSRLIEQSYRRDQSQSGLLRIELDSKKPIGSHTIEEVMQLSCRYSDGASWHKEWNSFLKGNRLPHAVEITVEVSGRLGSPYRTVVSLPAGSHLQESRP